MKISKKSNQRNFVVNLEHYTESKLNEMAKKGIIIKDTPPYFNESGCYRVSADDCSTVKVILNDYGHYTTVVVHNTGMQIVIEL